MALSLSATLALNLECPVCMEIPRDFPIYQCNNGHLLCKNCRDQLKTCPVCKIRLRYTRNLAVEKILENLPVPCKFERYGCTRELVKVERVKHEKSCEFREIRCPFLECRSLLSIARLEEHLPDHSINANTVNGSANLSLTVEEDTFGQLDLPTVYWKPQMMDFKDRLFFVAEKKDYQAGLFYIWVYLVGTAEQADKFSARIKIFGKEKNQLNFTCSVVSIDVEEDEIINTGAVLAFPDFVAKSLMSTQDNDSHLKIRVQLFCQNDEEDEDEEVVMQTQAVASKKSASKNEVQCAFELCNYMKFPLALIFEHSRVHHHSTIHAYTGAREGEEFFVSYNFLVPKSLRSLSVDLANGLKKVELYERLFYILTVFNVDQQKYLVWVCIVRESDADNTPDGDFEYEVSIKETEFKSRQPVMSSSTDVVDVIRKQKCCVIPKEKAVQPHELLMIKMLIQPADRGTKRIKLSS